MHFCRSSLINSKQNKVEVFFSPFILWLQTESAIPRIISHSAPAFKSSSDPNKTYQKAWVTPAIAGNMVTGGHRLIIIIQSSLITIPHDMPGPGRQRPMEVSHTRDPFGDHIWHPKSSLAPSSGPASQPRPQPNKQSGFSQNIHLAHKKVWENR